MIGALFAGVAGDGSRESRCLYGHLPEHLRNEK